jgi:hypothetical protein
MLVYVAIAALWEGQAAKGGRQVLVVIAVSMVAAGWLIRTGEAHFHLRDAAWENYQEWTARYEELGGFSRPQTDMLKFLRTAAIAQPPTDPRRDPAWSYTLFEREFDRSP